MAHQTVITENQTIILKALSRNGEFHKSISFQLEILSAIYQILMQQKSSKFCKSYVFLGMIPTINKRTRVIRQAASTIDHIITNSTMHTGFKLEIIKTDISDHFPIIQPKRKMLRRNLYINADSLINQQEYLSKDCEIQTGLVYNECFPVTKIKLK